MVFTQQNEWKEKKKKQIGKLDEWPFYRVFLFIFLFYHILRGNKLRKKNEFLDLSKCEILEQLWESSN